MSSRITLEVSVTTPDEAVRAVEAGADRLELCSALDLGGVTPSPGAFQRTRERLQSTPIYVLIRPRPGDFCYSASEFDTIRRDAQWFLQHGANGIVVGILNEDARINRVRCAELVALAQGKAVFHRAFDFIADQFGALEHFIELGFERVLTSGGALTAPRGAARIAELIHRAAGRIEVLPGAGINPDNAVELIRATGCTQVHGSFRSGLTDQNLNANPDLAVQMGQVLATDAEIVRRMRVAVDSGLRHPRHGQ